MFAWEGAVPAWAVFCLGAAAHTAIWGFICILHSQPPWSAPGWHFYPHPAVCSWFPLLPGLPDVLSSCVQPRLWSRERRWQRPEGFLEKFLQLLGPSGLPGEGSQRWWPFPGVGTFQTSVHLLMWVGVSTKCHSQLPKTGKSQIPALLSHLPQGSCPGVFLPQERAFESSQLLGLIGGWILLI